jgi:lambda repressor-like predicted transcriptional regulator
MADARIPRQAPRTSRAQRAEILERFHKSGLTAAAFAARERVSLWTLRRWLAEAKRTTTPEFIFSEIKMPPLLAAPSPWAVEVVSARGVTVRCREALSLPELIRLLRG